MRRQAKKQGMCACVCACICVCVRACREGEWHNGMSRAGCEQMGRVRHLSEQGRWELIVEDRGGSKEERKGRGGR